MHEHMLQYPSWLQGWILWMGIVNFTSLLFLRRIQARWVLAAMLAAMLSRNALFALNGFNRLLGLAHIVFWTPLVVYLVRQRGVLAPGLFRTWVTAVVVTNGLSLVVDFVDVIRYVAGDRT